MRWMCGRLGTSSGPSMVIPNTRIKLWLLFGLLVFSHVPLSAHAASTRSDAAAVLAGKVTRVIDGDTIDVLLTSGVIRVRFHGIDAPERDQPGGAAATTWLTQQLVNQQVLLEPVSQDQYDRMIAVVLLQKRNINRELVKTGHAWAYRHYLRRSDADLCKLEANARLKGVGLWAATARAPWEHRATNGKGPFKDYRESTAADCRREMGR
jgi:micrococcal nuclease